MNLYRTRKVCPLATEPHSLFPFLPKSIYVTYAKLHPTSPVEKKLESFGKFRRYLEDVFPLHVTVSMLPHFPRFPTGSELYFTVRDHANW
jgi:hypothetical protein